VKDKNRVWFVSVDRKWTRSTNVDFPALILVAVAIYYHVRFLGTWNVS